MTEFTNKPSYDEIFNELAIIQMTNSKLNNEIRRLRKNIQKIHDDQGLEICDYFDMCNSIKDTSDKYCFEDVEDCYWALVEYFGGVSKVEEANDYKECYKEIFDSQEEKEELAGQELTGQELTGQELTGQEILENENAKNLVVEDLDEN